MQHARNSFYIENSNVTGDWIVIVWCKHFRIYDRKMEGYGNDVVCIIMNNYTKLKK